jgi:hypothetical protein
VIVMARSGLGNCCVCGRPPNTSIIIVRRNPFEDFGLFTDVGKVVQSLGTQTMLVVQYRTGTSGNKTKGP